MSASPRATTPSSRCSAISPSATISRSSAIELAWNLLTKELGLPKDKLTVTVYQDDDEAHGALEEDRRAAATTRIVRLGAKSNFWQMGDTGPCGPCSEIFYDHGDKFWGGPPGSPEEDGDRFIEIWNLVFMQFEQHADGSRTGLPRPSIDTGMGLERVAGGAAGHQQLTRSTCSRR